ncbi:hypothetical protein QO010_000613 [Caulobacter ginsengisoli]|uniref:Iminophenyl-pyruvate dimer synthase domain-containing protein n=1 Tax=Caulobacter ginsengisoli TaxID=400775 RepID=A0ABU0ILG7_9CAUL|nr:ferritin-like protein [Caulobacter ginsengisoli]MDQ0462865.1 hypothetical protein [Caulobacter ginsengisoli]
MLYLRAAPVSGLDGLQTALQNAVQLEHATIPPYLTAFYTLAAATPGVAQARAIIRSVVMQEMLHMLLASNILNAIGGAPAINAKGFIPSYPGPLPMGIGYEDGPKGLEVGIVRYSQGTVQDVFMNIEEPEQPITIPVKPMALAAVAPKYQTIGQFYGAVAAEIKRLGPAIFTGDRARQVTDMPGAIEVIDVDTALAAIQVIVRQGEGTPASPLDMSHELAHYYRFEELAKGMTIVPDPHPPGYAFDPNQPITVDDKADVTPMVDNPQLVDFSGDWRAQRLADECDIIYGKLLNALHLTFNGQPHRLFDATAVMFEFKNAAEELLQQQLTKGPNAGQYAGPRYLYVGPQ